MFDTEVRVSRSEPMAYDEYLARGETMHHEYYDGVLTLNPPSKRHVVIARRLTRLLEDAAPPAYEVLPEYGWRLRPCYDFEPDIIVSERGAPGPDLLRVPPLLVVEVTSPSMRMTDTGRKAVLYAEGGLPWYWVLDPDNSTVTVLHNQDGRFERVQVIEAGTVTMDEPFTVTLDTGRIFAQ